MLDCDHNSHWSFHWAVPVCAVILAVLGASPTVHAYQTETHCYDTYEMARRVGFTNEYAKFFCTGAEWVDQGIMSTPMSPLPITGELLRRLYHAPTRFFQAQNVTQDGHASAQITATAEPNHPVASRLLDEGLRQGNWFKLALAIHVLEDSFGHAGYWTTLLHLYSGHNPDRTWMAVAKYKEMTGVVFQALLAIRAVAPDEALEPWAREARKQPLDLNEYKKLENDHWQDVEKLIARDYLRDPRYTPKVVDYILRLAKAKGYLNPIFDVNAHLPGPSDYLLTAEEQEEARKKYAVKFKDGTPTYVDEYALTRKDARQVLKDWVVKMRKEELAHGILVTGSIFNMKILDYYGRRGVREALLRVENEIFHYDIQERIAAHNRLITPEQEMQIIEQTVDFISDHQIPIEFDEYHHTQFESDDGPRALEQQLVISDRREQIYQRHGVNVEFKANTRASRIEAKAQKKREEKIQKLDPKLNLTLPVHTPGIPTRVPIEVMSFKKHEQFGMVAVKTSYNIRALVGDIRDVHLPRIGKAIVRLGANVLKLTGHVVAVGGPRHIDRRGGKYTLSQHANVLDYQHPELLQQNIASGRYQRLGSLANKNFYGSSRVESCEDLMNRE